MRRDVDTVGRREAGAVTHDPCGATASHILEPKRCTCIARNHTPFRQRQRAHADGLGMVSW